MRGLISAFSLQPSAFSPQPASFRMPSSSLSTASLLVCSHVQHYRYDGRLHAFAPYARELELWAGLFRELVIAAPLCDAPPPADTVAFAARNIRLVPVPLTGGARLRDKLRLAVCLPVTAWRLSRALWAADAAHVRCPGNMGLLGLLLAPLIFRLKRLVHSRHFAAGPGARGTGLPLIAKYAGQWSRYPTEPCTFRLQRWLLRSRWWGSPVTVYGDWPGQPSHVVPFFTSVMTAGQMERAREAAAARTCQGAPRVLFVGRLTRPKNVDVLLQAMSLLAHQGLRLPATIVGEGPDRGRLETLAKELQLCAQPDPQVTFAGGLPFDDVLAAYAQHDVLVLVSDTEGWPKAITEAMAFGVVCVAARQGIVPRMLADGRGLTVPGRDPAALADALRQLANMQPATRLTMSRAAAAWGQQYSAESLQAALRDVLVKHWDTRPGTERHAVSPKPRN